MSEALSFPRWLKLRRRGLGLTQEQLAKQCFCAVISIKRIESGDLFASTALAEAIGRATGVPIENLPVFVTFARNPNQTLPPAHFEQPIKAQPATNAAPPALLYRAPAALNSFVGRVTEMRDICILLQTDGVRLMTLIGPPGSGKTRLALQVALRLQDVFANGACIVPVSGCRSPDDVINVLARMLKVSPNGNTPLLERIVAQLQPLNMLLVLDNFEHVLIATSVVDTLLQGAGQIRVLVTSREPLRIQGEHEYPVAPLALPDMRDDSILLAQNDAVRLFYERARSVRPDLVLNQENVHTLAAICRMLDGVPLAIEMAAARIKYQPASVVFEQLKGNLSTLGNNLRDGDTRHRTLRDAIAWSVNLLSPDQQDLFGVLGVFENGFTPELVGQVLGPDLLVIFDPSQLYALVEANLLRINHTALGAPRFSMLSILRDHARERLRENGQLAPLLERIAHVMGRLVLQATSELYTDQQRHWLEVLDQEHGNIQAAQHWSLQHDIHLALSIAAHMTDPRYVRGYWAESHAALLAAIQAADGIPAAQLPKPVYSHALRNAAFMAHLLGDRVAAGKRNLQALALSEELADLRGQASVHRNLGLLARDAADAPAALAHFETSLAMFVSLQINTQVAWLRELIGQVHSTRGEHSAAREHLVAALALRREAGGMRGIADTTFWLARDAYRSADYTRCALLMRECIDLNTRISDRQGLALAPCGLAAAQTRLGEAEFARASATSAVQSLRGLGDRNGLAWALQVLGEAHLAMGDPTTATDVLREAATLAQSLGDTRRAALCHEALACALLSDPAAASVHAGMAQRLREQAHAPVLASERAQNEQLKPLRLQHPQDWARGYDSISA